MKKAIVICLAVMMGLALAGCGGKDSSGNGGGEASKYGSALEVLNAVRGVYAEADMFAIYGGDQENAVMDEPGAFDISKTEELDLTLGLPASQASGIEDAASMVHMMNANIFTGAAYRLKEDTDRNTFVDEVKANILNRQWICGQPDTLIILKVDGEYVITAFGEAGIMEIFKTNALSALEGAEVMAEVPIA